jgi:hypothetical protein
MPKAADWRASEVEIVDGEFIRPQGSGANPSASGEETIEWIAWLMDRSIPIGGMRVGLDPILGLIPGLGDVFSSLISTVIIMHAHRAGVPRATVLRMMANVGIDTAVGAVPLVGDVFDFAWKANSKNLELYRTAVRGERRAGKDWGFLALVMVGLFVLVAVPIFLAIWMFRALF